MAASALPVTLRESTGDTMRAVMRLNATDHQERRPRTRNSDSAPEYPVTLSQAEGARR